jgi:hypothetical protein
MEPLRCRSMRGNVRFQMLTYSITSSALAIE